MASIIFHTWAQLAQYMIRLVDSSANEAIAHAPPSGNGRFWSGSCLRMVSNTRGPLPNDSTVRLVTISTRLCQLGNGRKKMHPTTNARIRLSHGTPVLFTLARDAGALRLRPIA